jgi:hypothetical protein
MPHLEFQPRRIDPASSCLSKHRHATKQEARDHVVQQKRDGGFGGGDVVIYHCPLCDGFHIGHKMGQNRSKPKVKRKKLRFS